MGATVILAATACANPESADERLEASTELVASASVDEDIAQMLPDDRRDAGGISVSINPDVEPVKFVDEQGEIAGMNPDLLRAAANVLDTEIHFERGTFDAMVPGLESKRFDVIGSVADFEERRDNIDFINYMQNGTAIITGADYELDELRPADFCGMSIGYARGTSQQGSLESIVSDCEEAGEEPPSINGYQDGAAGILSVSSGEADAFWGDLPAMEYNVAIDPESFKIIYTEHGSILGIGIHKDNQELTQALQAAIQQLVEDGIYEDLLDTWALENVGMPDIPLNSGGSLED